MLRYTWSEHTVKDSQPHLCFCVSDTTLLSQENPEVQDQCKNAMAMAMPSRPSPAVASELPKDGWGLCGTGDLSRPVALSLFEPIAAQLDFVMKSHQMWVSKHSEVLGSVRADLPERKQTRQCHGLCWNSQQTGHLTDFEVKHSSTKNLLLNICRSMKPLYKQIDKQIQHSSQHPLLLVRSMGSDGQVLGYAGWILTLASFKPLQADGIELSLPPVLDCPCELEVKTATVWKSSRRSFSFATMDRIMFEIVSLSGAYAFRPGFIEYCFAPAYCVLWPNTLTKLKLKSVSWVPIVYAEPEDNDNDDDDDADEDGDQKTIEEKQEETDELDELQDLVAGLLSTEEPQRKSRPKAAPKGNPKKRAAVSAQHSEQPKQKTRKTEKSKTRSGLKFSEFGILECNCKWRCMQCNCVTGLWACEIHHSVY